MSSSSAAPSTSASSTPPSNSFGNPGPNSSLYLFTFLVTVLVLALISSLLLYRAYYIRRRHLARVEEAIRNNQPLPPDAARALGLIPGGRAGRGKREKKLGPMPGMWEAEMRLDKSSLESRGEKGFGKWDEFTPLSITQKPINSDISDYLPEYYIPPPRQRRFLPSWVPITQPLPRRVNPDDQPPATLTRSGPNYTIPPKGDEVTVGVLIALPFEDKVGNLWDVRYTEEGDEEGEVPEVVLGVVAVVVE